MLYRKEHKRMEFTARKILFDMDMAEDVVQTVFTSLFKNVDLLMSFESPNIVSRYIFICVKNTSLRFNEKFRFHSSLDELDDICPYEECLEDEEILKFDVKKLMKIITEMDSRYGDALYLKFCLGLSYTEIADALSCKVVTARNRVYLDREILKKARKQGDLDG